MKQHTLLKTMTILTLYLLVACGGNRPMVDIQPTPTELQSTPTKVVSHSTLMVGISADVPPFMFWQGGEVVGFDKELIERVATESGFEVEWVEISDWAEAFNELSVGRYDVVISAATITSERQTLVNFTVPYFTTGQVIVTSIDSHIRTLADLTNQVIAVQAGTTGEQWAEANVEAPLQRFNSAEKVFEAVSEGTAIAAVYDEISADAYVRTHPTANLEIALEPVTAESYAIAVRQDTPEIQQRLDAALQSFMQTADFTVLCQKWQIGAGCQIPSMAELPATITPTVTAVSTALPLSTPAGGATAVSAEVNPPLVHIISPESITSDVVQTCTVVAHEAEERDYVIQSGESLWQIAENEYGEGIYFRAIAAFNADSIKDPAIVRPNQRLSLPSRQQADEWMAGLVPTLPEVVFDTGGAIMTTGSSTLFPLTRRLAECFMVAAGEQAAGYEVSIESIGSSAGINEFCQQGRADIINASRPMTLEERERCAANRGPVVELQVGVDAILIVVSEQNQLIATGESLTLAEVQQLLSTAVTWHEVRAEWPEVVIERFYPTTDSGTFTVAAERLYGAGGETQLANAPHILLSSEEDTQLAARVAASPFGVAFFGAAYGQQFDEQIKILAIDGRTPQPETVDSPTPYLLLRPLYLYTTAAVLAEKPQVYNFIVYYLDNVNHYIHDVGYFPVSSQDFPAQINLLNQVIP